MIKYFLYYSCGNISYARGCGLTGSVLDRYELHVVV